MACWELESRLRLALTLYDLVGIADERRAREIALGAASAPADSSPSPERSYLEEFRSLYADWLQPSEEILAVIKEMEQQGYEVEGAARYRQVCSQLGGLLSIPVENILRSMNDLRQRKFRPLGEVRDELRGRSGA